MQNKIGAIAHIEVSRRLIHRLDRYNDCRQTIAAQGAARTIERPASARRHRSSADVRPRLFPFDEPLSNLDAAHRLRAEIKRLHQWIRRTALRRNPARSGTVARRCRYSRQCRLSQERARLLKTQGAAAKGGCRNLRGTLRCSRAISATCSSQPNAETSSKLQDMRPVNRDTL
jgi:hypothetical protein